MTPVRAVLDTNVLVSALVFPTRRVSLKSRAWPSGRGHPLASRDVAAELIRVLTFSRFRLDVNQEQDLLDDQLPSVSRASCLTPTRDSRVPEPI